MLALELLPACGLDALSCLVGSLLWDCDLVTLLLVGHDMPSLLQQLSAPFAQVVQLVMTRQNNSRNKRAGSLGDSASDSGKILSYQRMPQDMVKPIPPDGTAELTSQAVASPDRGKQRAKVGADPSCRNGFATGRSEVYSSSETSRSRLSSANLEQNLRNHPQSLDYHGEHLASGMFFKYQYWMVLLLISSNYAV